MKSSCYFWIYIWKQILYHQDRWGILQFENYILYWFVILFFEVIFIFCIFVLRYPHKWNVTDSIPALVAEFKDLSDGTTIEGRIVSIAGRVKSKRESKNLKLNLTFSF